MNYDERVFEFAACAAREERAAKSASSVEAVMAHSALAEMYRDATAKAVSAHSASDLPFGSGQISDHRADSGHRRMRG